MSDDERIHWKLFKICPLFTQLALTMVWIIGENLYKTGQPQAQKKSAHEETAAIPPHQQSGQRRKGQDVAKIQSDSSICSADIF